MAKIDDVINSLSSDELDLLHNDPTLLAQFKEKYSGPAYDSSLAGRDARISALTSPMAEGAKAGLSAALPSPSYSQPIQGQTEGGLSSTPQAALSAAMQTLRDPTRISPTVSQPGQVAGDKISTGLESAGVNPTVAKGAGFATSMALDPQTYIGMGDSAGKAGAEGIGKLSDLVNDGLAKISKWKYGANVSDKAAEIARKAKFDLPAGTPGDIETAVERVQSVLNQTKDTAGAILNDAKAKIGIPVTVEDKEASLLAGKGTHGLGKDEVNPATQAMLDSKTPEDLASHIAQFKQMASAGNSDPKLTARVANALQDKVNQFVDWNKTGSQVEGVLKQQYKDLGHIVTDNAIGLQDAKGQMAKTLDVFNDLKAKLADPDKSGKAEQFLRNLFTSKSAANKDYLEQLANLEHISGKPVLSDLFKQFAGEAYSKMSGSPAGIGASLGEIGTAVALGHPLAAGLGLGAMAAQSPVVIKGAGVANQALSKATQAAIQSKIAKFGLNAGLVTLNKDRTLQSVLDKLKAGKIQSLKDLKDSIDQ